ncbi:MAG: ABC transporter permease, partial [Blastocatellia bacterium]
MPEFIRRLRYLLNRSRFDRELAGDMEFHREMAARETGNGFGDPLRIREEAREAWGWTWIDRFGQDLRYGARMLLKSPGFTAAAVLMLALGIGVNVAVFGFFDLMVLRPLPIRDPGTLRQFLRADQKGYADDLPYPEAAFYSEHSKTLSAVLAVSFERLEIEGEAKQIDAHFVTPNFFHELGARAELGRMLDPSQDESPGSAPVVVLNHWFWQSHFGADPSVIEKTIRLNGQPATVIGVVSEEFSGLSLGGPALWTSITQEPYFSSGAESLTDFSEHGVKVFMWGRLRPGLTPKAAEGELASLAAELRKQYPKDIWENETLPSRPGGYATPLVPAMYPLLALIGTLCLLILVVACANLGSLLMARGVAREHEIAIRVAIGAGRARLIRQLLTESLLLALLGVVAGSAAGYVILRALMALADVRAWLHPAPDWRVIAFATGIGLGSAILFGLAPAFQTTHPRLRGSVGTSPRRTLMRQLLIGSQVAASCILLILGGLLVRALDRAMSASPGFDFQQVISIDPGLRGYSAGKARIYFDSLESRLREIPGVESVAMASNPPLGNRWTVAKAEINGHSVNIHFNSINPPFFQTMDIPLLRGRNLKPGDGRAVIV